MAVPINCRVLADTFDCVKMLILDATGTLESSCPFELKAQAFEARR
jgi:hypothetical protein